MKTPEAAGFEPGQDELEVVHNGLLLALQTSRWLDPSVTTQRHGIRDREFRVARLPEAVSRKILGERAAEYSEVAVNSRTAPKDPRDPTWAGVVLRDAREDYHWLNPGTNATQFTVHKDPALRVLGKEYSIIKQVPWSTRQYGTPILETGEAGEQRFVIPVVKEVEDPLEAEIMEAFIRDMQRVTRDDMALLDRAVLAVSAEA